MNQHPRPDLSMRGKDAENVEFRRAPRPTMIGIPVEAVFSGRPIGVDGSTVMCTGYIGHTRRAILGTSWRWPNLLEVAVTRRERHEGGWGARHSVAGSRRSASTPHAGQPPLTQPDNEIGAIETRVGTGRDRLWPLGPSGSRCANFYTFLPP
jgi:hypothetical protein